MSDDKLVAKRNAALNALLAAWNARYPDITLTEEGRIDDLPIGLNVSAERSGDMWHRTFTGKIYISVGGHYACDVRTKRFPENKRGGHSYDKIVDTLHFMYTRMKANDAARKERDEKIATLDAAIETIEESLSVKDSALYTTRMGRLAFEVKGLTESQALKLVEAAKEIGIVS